MASYDYISRDAALESVQEKVLICELLTDMIAKDASLFTLASINYSLKAIPAADVRPVVKAEWEKVTEQPYLRKHYHVVACSACHKRGNQGWKYCPNCGADMRGESDV